MSQGLKISFFVNHGDGFQTTIEKTIGKSGLTLQRNTLYQIPTSISDKIIVRPVLSFDTTEFNDVSSEGDILTVNYTVANPIDGETISATSDASWVNTIIFKKWFDNTEYTKSYKDVTVSLTNDSYQIQSGENVVLVIAATENSLYCQSVTITYE